MTDGPDAATTARLLDQAETVLHGVALDLLAHSHLLDKPFTDRPDLSPWTRSTGKVARAAHDLARDIRKHLGLPYRHGYRGLGLPPLTLEEVETKAREDGAAEVYGGHDVKLAIEAARTTGRADARAVERERIAQRITRDKIDWLIHLLDLLDKLATARGMEVSTEAQDDLRWLADVLDGAS